MDIVIKIVPILLTIAGVAIVLSGYAKARPGQAFIISDIQRSIRILIGRAGNWIPFLGRLDKMFYGTKAISLDLSNFNTSKVTDMTDMFSGSQATKGYARTINDANKLNASSNKPTGLVFIVK